MRLLRITAEGMDLFNGIVAVDFYAEQRVTEEDKIGMAAACPNVFLNSAIAFTGINASGKTSVLKVLEVALGIVGGLPINSLINNGVLSCRGGITFEIYYTSGTDVFRLKTVVRTVKDAATGKEEYIIDDEALYRKPAEKGLRKKNLFSFCDDDVILRRDPAAAYLLKDLSIVYAHNKETKTQWSVYSMVSSTNRNDSLDFKDIPDALICFLDPMIEYLKSSGSGEKRTFRLKFNNHSEIRLNSQEQLINILSSGTLRGINLFMRAFIQMERGGYLIVDEIENHFNKEIVATLIRMFLNKRINRNGGTLVFTTHYPELLDRFDRNDCIYIMRNKGGITAEKLSVRLHRNDIKKSDAYQSGYLQGTAPSYDAYMKMVKEVPEFLKNQGI